jgi:hypothetical protein
MAGISARGTGAESRGATSASGQMNPARMEAFRKVGVVTFLLLLKPSCGPREPAIDLDSTWTSTAADLP